ncbi:MAG: alpha/beta hydrolase [Pseudomonadota bacterium]|nr:alpha/beta hydrolase [Pseudomonadota bacterium]
MSALPDLFPGFESKMLPGKGAELFARTGGNGPPLVLLHGYPQTHAAWHRLAPGLAKHFSVIIPDLRGYGQSSCPVSDKEHYAYSKRAMAEDVAEAMASLGHKRFSLIGHDRGARVGYRLALDHGDRLDKLVLLDILPTYVMWESMNRGLAMSAYHWLFLAQPHPMPETLISKSPAYYLEHTLASWSLPKSLSVFDKGALKHYRALMESPERVHAFCEDYRAGQTYDYAADERDVKAGRKIKRPTLILWGTDYVAKRAASPLDTWKSWCEDVRGQSIVSGHFLAEEVPEETLKLILEFLRGE